MHDSFATALARLPHGAAFRFVDELRELVPGKSGAAAYRLRGDEHFLAGHFPGQPLMPGVLLLEAVAQLAGIVAQSDPAIAPLEGLKLTAVRAAKILGTVRPGDTLELRAEIVERLGLLIQAQGWAYGAGRLLLAAEITLSGEPPRSPPPSSG